jgi:oxygen-independent coproporphyrinogen-3 oxidase
MAGIYIHIPFCKQKCHYCNFFSVATGRFREEFLQALSREIIARKGYLGDEQVSTIYFGGGTPSLYEGHVIDQLIDELRLNFSISDQAEITLEANPDDITEEWLSSIRMAPVNRLSIGIQSFFDEDLLYLNRVHDGRQAMQSIELARNSGYDNLTIDLIYGIPGLTMEKWEKNLEIFFSLGIPHLSAYSLTVESRTALHLLIEKKKLPAPDEEESIRHFQLLQKMARDHGFVHYEISNFSLPGHFSRHNSLYWLGGNYLGLGPSAHSYNGHSRQWNVSNLGQYIRGEHISGSITEKEVLSEDQRYNEYVMTSLRTMWGCDSEHIRNIFGEKRARQFLDGTSKYIRQGLLKREGNSFYLTEEGNLFADGIASALFAGGSE